MLELALNFVAEATVSKVVTAVFRLVVVGLRCLLALLWLGCLKIVSWTWHMLNIMGVSATSTFEVSTI